MLGDSLALLAGIEPPDRVIIDYPHAPMPTYRAALSRVTPSGTLHYYEILEDAARSDREESLLEAARSVDRGATVVSWREVHGWSPTKKLFAFDVKVV